MWSGESLLSWFVFFWRGGEGDSNGSEVINDVFDFGASAFGASGCCFLVSLFWTFSFLASVPLPLGRLSWGLFGLSFGLVLSFFCVCCFS